MFIFSTLFSPGFCIMVGYFKKHLSFINLFNNIYTILRQHFIEQQSHPTIWNVGPMVYILSDFQLCAFRSWFTADNGIWLAIIFIALIKIKKNIFLLNRIDNMVVTLERQQVCTNTTVKYVIKWELGDLSFQNSHPLHELQLPLRTPKKMHFPGAIGKIIFIICDKWQQLNLGSVVLTVL